MLNRFIRNATAAHSPVSGPAKRNDTASPPWNTASSAAITRLRTWSGLRRWKITWTATSTIPSEAPATTMAPKAGARAGMKTTEPKAAAVTKLPTTIARRSVSFVSRFPSNEPTSAPAMSEPQR